MKKIKKYSAIFSLLIFVFTPFAVFSQTPINPGGTGLTYECTGGAPGDCTFTDLILAVKKFFDVAIPLALGFTVIIIAYAGFLYMSSGGSPGKRAQANKMFVSVGIGIFFMLAAWVIVTLILNSLANPSIPRLLN